MKSKKIILIIMSVVIISILMGCGTKNINVEAPIGTPIETQEKNQLNVILNNYEEWKAIDDGERYGYAITDLDQNGRLEIISSVEAGSGLYTYTNIYEVNENFDSIFLCENNYDEGESQADVMNTTEWLAYYDKTNNIYHYILTDDLRINAMEAIQGKRDYVLKDGRIIEKYLASKNIMLNEDGEENNFSLPNDNSITEEEYNTIGYSTFPNCEEKTLHVEWLYSVEYDFENMDTEELMNLLKYSYQKNVFLETNIIEDKITKEMAYEGVSNYCHEYYDWNVVEDNPYIMYLEMGEETEMEYQVILRSYTGSFVYFYVNKSNGATRMIEYVPTLEIENEVGNINIYDYLNMFGGNNK